MEKVKAYCFSQHPSPKQSSSQFYPSSCLFSRLLRLLWDSARRWRVIWERHCQREKGIDKDSGSGCVPLKLFPSRDPGNSVRGLAAAEEFSVQD